MPIAALCAAITAATGERFAAPRVRRAAGGDVSEAQLLDDGRRRFFVKLQTASRRDLFAAEADGLAALGAHLRVPGVIVTGIAEGRAYLVLEALDLAATGDAAALGVALAALHRAPQARFGWTRDNWIGATPQPNAWRDDWLAFWRTQRLGFQLDLAARNGHGGALQHDGEYLLAHLEGLFYGYTPAPSLLHGDLWGGNHGYLPDGNPVLFDPAVYVGDREADLAMSELFGGYAPDFYAAYCAAWPLDSGYPTRKILYNLYHILNHANLFGGGYAAQAARMAALLVAELK